MKTKMRFAAWGLVVGLLALVPAQALAAKKVLRLRLDGPVLEAPNDAQGLMALFQNDEVHSLREWVSAIQRAGQDANFAGLLLIIEQPQLSFAQTEELVRAVQKFRASGKPVYAYLDEAGNLAYALAAGADHITLAENSMLTTVGIHAEAMYLKGLLEKLGLQMQGLHMGAYKSALEMFTRTEPSPEAAENINWLLDGLYARWIQMIADGRKLSVDQVKELVNRAPLSAKDALEAKLVDEVSTFAAYRKRAQKEFGPDAQVVRSYESEGAADELDLNNPFAVFSLLTQMFQSTTTETKGAGLGLVYIEGMIVVGESDEGFLSGGMAGSTTIRAALTKALEDANCRAVVLRVNSPGGSALASDIIWNAAKRVGEEKPLIVSMGAVAGSGGYYVSVPGDTIFAEAGTITGSIGVVAGKLIWTGLLEGKLGITTTEFARGEHSGLMSASRGWNESERAWMEKFLEEVYGQFKGRIMASRGDRLKKDLEEMAGGRVYTGQQALELGLVDKIGGISDALEFAAGKAGLPKDCPVYIYPKPSGLKELVKFFKALEPKDNDEFQIALRSRLMLALHGGLPHDSPLSRVQGNSLLGALLPLARELAPEQFASVLRAVTNLSILQREQLGCVMDVVPQFR